MLEFLFGVFVGIVLKQRYKIPRIKSPAEYFTAIKQSDPLQQSTKMTGESIKEAPKQMWEKAKDFEKKQRQ